MPRAQAAAAGTGRRFRASRSTRLNGRPGVFPRASRGEGATDRENLEKLLDELRRCHAERTRGACFRCVIAFVRDARGSPSRSLPQGIWEGTIASEPRGSQRLRLRPVFVPQGPDRTAAQLTPEEKNDVSHRGQALRAADCAVAAAGRMTAHGRLRNACRWGSTCTFRGVCGSVRTAISIPSRCTGSSTRSGTLRRWSSDLEAQAADVGGRTIVSMFLGGGTPSLFSAGAIGRVHRHGAPSFAARGRRRSHARGQPGHDRARPVRRISRGRRQPRVTGRAELRCAAAADSRADPFSRMRRAARRRSCMRRASTISISISCTRCRSRMWPARCADVEAALALAAGASVALPAHDRARDGVRRASAGCPRMMRPPNAARLPRAAGRAGFAQYEVSAYARRPAVPAQPQLLDLRRLSRDRRRRARQTDAAADRQQESCRTRAARASRGATCAATRASRRYDRLTRRERAELAVRIHAECAAAGGWLRDRPVRSAHRA